MASAAGKHLRVWDACGELLFHWEEHSSTIAAIAWRGDGHGIASAGYGEVNLFRLAESAPYETLAWRGSLISVAWSPNARFIAAGSQEASLRFWRLPYRLGDELEMTGYPGKILGLAWDRMSRFLGTSGAGELIMVWDVSGKGPAGRRPKILRGHQAKIIALAFEQDGDLLFSGDTEGRICVWDLSKSATPRAFFQAPGKLTALRISREALAVGTVDGEVTVWSRREISSPSPCGMKGV